MANLRWMILLELWTVAFSRDLTSCTKRIYLARAEQIDPNGLRCWDTVKVPSCGGRCDSREISDWQFPFKLSRHPVCGFGARKPLIVRLRHCDPGVAAGTEVFHYVAADDCRCKVCSSQHTSCEWLPPNSTLLDALVDDGDSE
ncbi:thyrostimulin beta-5 subunit-like [Pectinophora gossypiella]|uniref:thyrostimulin beta-5 subunit-like n=1 Tax=Pectinophora gossypiella TaxID=13191 RepID=UPI00214E1CC4|nr:thyrostimulin beta-5 subunit-like [Pectinophora gossypiella]